MRQDIPDPHNSHNSLKHFTAPHSDQAPAGPSLTLTGPVHHWEVIPAQQPRRDWLEPDSPSWLPRVKGKSCLTFHVSISTFFLLIMDIHYTTKHSHHLELLVLVHMWMTKDKHNLIAVLRRMLGLIYVMFNVQKNTKKGQNHKKNGRFPPNARFKTSDLATLKHHLIWKITKRRIILPKICWNEHAHKKKLNCTAFQ